jgi:hypothetical protein
LLKDLSDIYQHNKSLESGNVSSVESSRGKKGIGRNWKRDRQLFRNDSLVRTELDKNMHGIFFRKTDGFFFLAAAALPKLFIFSLPKIVPGAERTIPLNSLTSFSITQTKIKKQST